MEEPMTFTKKEFLRFLEEQISDQALLDVVFHVEEPIDNNSLTGTTFGSATHMIRNQRREHRGQFEVDYRYYA